MVEREMPRPSVKRYATDDHRRALRLLAEASDGHTDAVMMAHGFSATLLCDLVEAELVTARRERVRRGGRIIEVVRLRITQTGRKSGLSLMTNKTAQQQPSKPEAANERNDRLLRALGSAKVALLNRSNESHFEQLAVAALADIDAADRARKSSPLNTFSPSDASRAAHRRRPVTSASKKWRGRFSIDRI